MTSRVSIASLFLLSLLPSAAMAQESSTALCPAPARNGVVFAVSGSAEMGAVADTLTAAFASSAQALEVRPFRWSHGGVLVLMDLRSQSRHQAKGRELACQIQSYRESSPGAKVHLVGFSAGAAIILSAVEHLPPGCIDRIVFLAPACSTHQDLRPALICAREGIDLFYSTTDLVCQTLPLVGTTDGRRYAAAGAAGFLPVEVDERDGAIFTNLRQHQDDFWGHFACLKTDFLRKHVVPLLDAAPIANPAPQSAATSEPASLFRPVSLPSTRSSRNGLTPLGEMPRVP